MDNVKEAKGREYVLPISRFAEYCGIFEGKNFGLSAIDFYRKIGHTLTCEPYLTADDIDYCIYYSLGFRHSFVKVEREAFSYIQQLSLLFELDDNTFDIATNRTIRYYAIELSVKKNYRSRVAYIIHNAFTRESEHCAVIIFRNHGKCMLSISHGKGKYDNTIYLSDWIDANSSMDYISRFMAYNLSFLSSISFISDFIYYSAREYYIYSPSKDYTHNNIFNMGIFGTENQKDWDITDEFVEYKNYYARMYGDDYIETEWFDNPQIEGASDLDFDLLELELDETSDSDILEESNELDETEDDFLGNNMDSKEDNQIDISEIDKHILDDPVELLKWIKNRKGRVNK